MNILSNQILPITPMDVIARDVLGSSTSGCSVAGASMIHLVDDASVSDQNKAQKIFDNWGNLNPAIDKTSMIVGDADPVITFDTADSEVGYVVLLDGGLYGSGTVVTVSGTATLELDAPEAGTYEIYVYRLAGNFASGSVTITVSEV